MKLGLAGVNIFLFCSTERLWVLDRYPHSMFGAKIRKHHILHPNTIIPLIISSCIYSKEAGPKCLKEGQNPPIPVHIAMNILGLEHGSFSPVLIIQCRMGY